MERISVFMDGEAAHVETRQAMARLKDNDDCRETWDTFHLIGDMMRGDAMLSDKFLTGFRARMELEPTQLAPRVTWRKSATFALSAAASLSAVAIVLTLVLADNPLRPQAPSLPDTRGRLLRMEKAGQNEAAAPYPPQRRRAVCLCRSLGGMDVSGRFAAPYVYHHHSWTERPDGRDPQPNARHTAAGGRTALARGLNGESSRPAVALAPVSRRAAGRKSRLQYCQFGRERQRGLYRTGRGRAGPDAPALTGRSVNSGEP